MGVCRKYSTAQCAYPLCVPALKSQHRRTSCYSGTTILFFIEQYGVHKYRRASVSLFHRNTRHGNLVWYSAQYSIYILQCVSLLFECERSVEAFLVIGSAARSR